MTKQYASLAATPSYEVSVSELYLCFWVAFAMKPFVGHCAYQQNEHCTMFKYAKAK